MPAVEVVNEYLRGLPGGARRLAHAGWALGPGHELDPWLLLSAGGVTPAGHPVQ